jgi:hypothetical protein
LKARRHGRERGCHIYVSAEALAEAGWPEDAPAPFYRTVGFKRSARGMSVIVSLYHER